jgi:REP element-mobilizing transposase RayT
MNRGQANARADCITPKQHLNVFGIALGQGIQMCSDAQRLHRRSIRLRGYDYTQAGAYFVTVCTWQRECVLGRIEDRTLIPSEWGRIVDECWRALPPHFPNVALDAFAIMPNHVHGIIVIRDDPNNDGRRGEAFLKSRNASPLQGTQPGSLGAILQNFKSVSTRKINQIRDTPGLPMWQRNYYEHIIRDERELKSIREYIVNNPIRWETDVENPAVQDAVR